MTHAQVQMIAQAREKLGPKGVITEAAEIQPWATDWRGRVHGASPAIFAPASTEEAAYIVWLATQYRVPLVPQGGNTEWRRVRLRRLMDRRSCSRCGG